MMAELAPLTGTDFSDQFLGLEADLPNDLPGLSVDDIFDEYLCVLGTTAASGVPEAAVFQDEATSVAQLGAGSVGSSQWNTASPGYSGGSTLLGEGGFSGRANSTGSWNAGTANSHGSGEEYRLTADSPGCGGQESRQTFPSATNYGAIYAEQPWQRGHCSQHSTSLPPVVELPQNCQATTSLPNCSPAMSLEIPLPDFEIFPHPVAQSLDWLDAAVHSQDFGTESHALLPSFQEESRLRVGTACQNAVNEIFPEQALPDMSHHLGGMNPCAVSAGRQQGSLVAEKGVSGALSGGGVISNQSEGDQTHLRSAADASRVDAKEHELHSDNEDADMEGSPKKERRRRNRSERQQMLNKLAQQRYRERKRQKALDVEKAAAELSARMKEYSMVQQKHKALSEHNQALQQRLAEKDAELAEHASVAAGSKPGQAAGPGDSMATHGDRAEEVDRLTLELHESVFQLRQHLDSFGLLHAVNSVSLDALPPPALGKIERLVEEVSRLSIRAQRIEGVDVWHLVMRKMGSSGCLPGCTCYACRHKETWSDIAASLCLTPEQSRKLLHIREQYARRLDVVFQERRQLNLEAVSTMLPPQDRAGSAADLLSGQVASRVFLGFFQRARHSAKLSDVLHALKQNLRAEQRAASEIDYITFRRILNPLQGAIFILEAYPLKCDALALSHAVHGFYENSRIGSTS